MVGKFFSLEMTIENPALRVAPTHSREANIHSADGVSGSRIAAYRSFVERVMQVIKEIISGRWYFHEGAEWYRYEADGVAEEDGAVKITEVKTGVCC